MIRKVKLSTFLAMALIIVIALILVEYSRAANTSDSVPVVRVSKGKVTPDGLGLRAMLIVRLGSNSKVTDMRVIIATCRHGQQLPFRVHLGRKLDARNEKFSSSNDGKTLIWSIFNVPDSSSEPVWLPLQFEVPLGMGGPTYCIRVWGVSFDGSLVSEPTRLVWKL